MSDDQEQRRLVDDDAPNAPNEDAPADAATLEEEDSVEALPFEDAIEELETIVQDLEDGDLALEDAMDRFERGLALVQACQGKLEQAELRVEELLDDGSTEPLED